MTRTITIDPVTRIEGHARITLTLGDDGQVNDARFHLTQFRGFERITQGRPVHEMPAIMARISFSGELGYEIYVAPPYQLRLAEAIEVGQFLIASGVSQGASVSTSRRSRGIARATSRSRPGSTAASSSAGVLQLRPGPRKNPVSGTRRSCSAPSGFDASTALASSASSGTSVSPAGEALHTLPPMVAASGQM